MVLPAAPNTIYLSQINTELGYASNNPIFLNNGDVRQLAKGAAPYYVHTPSYSTPVYMSEFRGKDVGGSISYTTPGAYTFTFPLNASLVVDVRGGGGGGGGGTGSNSGINQEGNFFSFNIAGSSGGSGGGSSFGGVTASGGGGGGGSGTGTQGAGGTGGGGNNFNGGGGGAGGFGAFRAGNGGAGGRAVSVWGRGTFGVGGTITVVVGGGGGGGRGGGTTSPGTNGNAGGSGAVYITWN